METLSSHVLYKNIQSYWRHRTYERLDGGTSTSKRTVRLGGGTKSKRRRVVLFRLKPKNFPSPKKLLVKLRDAYVGAMLSWSGGAATAPPRKRDRKSRKTNDVAKIGDFEMRMIYHIYNSVMENPRELMMISARAESSSL
ncbi:Uncharacterized protein M6B38_226035 [Iris pallida]|uniref:Uncharacterized protein n=1 Tax=Iris pallida TaxID=29817 RepID=A0AAX6DV75_IRIPA|nr:Uncharacterized protein M6B38_226035 [Iris pallida]